MPMSSMGVAACELVNVSKPSASTEIGSYNAPGEVYGVTVAPDGDYYVSTSLGAVAILTMTVGCR